MTEDLTITFEEWLPPQGPDPREIYLDYATRGKVILHCASENEAIAFRFQCYRAKRRNLDWRNVRIAREGKDLIFHKPGVASHGI